MPPTEDMIAEATVILGQVQVVSFRATPDRLDPSNSTTTITWKVNRPQHPGLTLRLNGMNIPNEGSRTFTQFDTQTYRLSAHLFTVNTTLRQLTVVYDTSRCI